MLLYLHGGTDCTDLQRFARKNLARWHGLGGIARRHGPARTCTAPRIEKYTGLLDRKDKRKNRRMGEKFAF